MVVCFAFGCNHRSMRNTCSFFRFPRSMMKHAIWTKMARRSDRNPDNDSRLCSCHFEGGLKCNYPTIFDYNTGKNIEIQSERKRSEKIAAKDTNSDMKENNCYKAENVCLQIEVEQLKDTIKGLEQALIGKNTKFSFSSISNNNKYVLMFTGLPNKNIFYCILNYISRLDFQYAYDWKVEALTYEDQLFITLQKLRLNYCFLDLAARYSVSETTIRNVFFTFLHLLHECVFKSILEQNVPSLSKIQNSINMIDFPNCRFLIDTTEIFIENPHADLDAQGQTFKGLLAIAPNGVICYVSKLWSGSVSDEIIFKDCGIIKLLNPGDLIVADKGFLIHDLLPQGVSLNIPPFSMNAQFTQSEARCTTEIARIRVHVERAINRIKNFDILHNIPHHLHQSATIIFQVCAALVNLQNPIL